MPIKLAKLSLTDFLQMALAKFGNAASMEFRLNERTTKGSLLEGFQNLMYSSTAEKTNLNAGLQELRTQVFENTQGDRYIL